MTDPITEGKAILMHLHRRIYSGDDLRVDLVTDGTYWMDGGAMFGLVPKVLWETVKPPDAHNRVEMALNCLLIRTDEETILVDTGFGTKLEAKALQIFAVDKDRPGLIGALDELDVAPEDIDLVINTHLHADHCGGDTRQDGNRLVPTFPNARYQAQRIEWAEAMYPNERTQGTYLRENYEPLEQLGVIDLVDGNVRVSQHVSTIVTIGHTTSHQCVMVEPEDSPPIVFLGDLAPSPIHLERYAWIPGVDILPIMSLESKRSMARWVADTDAICVFQHETDEPVGTLQEDGRHFKFTPIEGPALP